MNNIELKSPLNGVPNRLFRDIEIGGCESFAYSGNLVHGQFSDDIHVIRKSWLAVSHTRHGTNHSVMDTFGLEEVGSDLHQFGWLKFSRIHISPIRD
ncbi:MAG: hypothetical protein ABL921_02385 [Pirellula sp.]